MSNNSILRLQQAQDLSRLPAAVKRSLRQEVDLGTLSSKLCPFELLNQTIVIFTLEEYLYSDQIQEVERLLMRKYRLLGAPERIIVSPMLLASLVREQLQQLQHKRAGTDIRRTAMSEALQEIISWGVRNGASDIHLNILQQQATAEVRFTIAGCYVAPEIFQTIPSATLLDMLSVAWMDIQGGNGSVFDPLSEQQGRLYREVDQQRVLLRWASLAADSGVSVCLRLLSLELSAQMSSLADLGYLSSHLQILERARLSEGGAVILAGVVGSGKSTTIASIMRQIPRTRKVVSVEDPVEYLIPGALQNSVIRALDGSSQHAFDAKLKTIKRSAMNDLLIGEIRDQETGRAFMDLVGSGSNVYTTTHAGSALLITERLSSEFIGIPRDFLTTPGILKLLVYQALLPQLCTYCSFSISIQKIPSCDALGRPQPYDYWGKYLERIATMYAVDPSTIRFRNTDGCAHCRHDAPELSGYQGRTVVAEMIEPTFDDDLLEALQQKKLIKARQHWMSLRTHGYDHENMQGKLVGDCALYKALQGQLDPRDIESRLGSYEMLEEVQKHRTPSLV